MGKDSWWPLHPCFRSLRLRPSVRRPRFANACDPAINHERRQERMLFASSRGLWLQYVDRHAVELRRDAEPELQMRRLGGGR